MNNDAKNKQKNNVAPGATNFRFLGDAMNYIGIVMNIFMTTVAMLGLPSKDDYDNWWTGHGFCVNGSPDRSIDTELVCFVLPASSALALVFFNKKHEHEMNDQLYAKLSGGIFGNFSHRFGHLFLLFHGGPPPPMEFSLTLDGCGNILVTFYFFVAVFKVLLISSSTRGAVVMAVVVLAAQYMLDVPPRLAFTYSQSVILLATAIDQLALPAKDKGFTYTIVAASYIPLFSLDAMEITQCTTVLASLGSHSLYNLYRSVLPFVLFYSVQRYEGKSGTKVTKA